jgi:hypothetical protein
MIVIPTWILPVIYQQLYQHVELWILYLVGVNIVCRLRIVLVTSVYQEQVHGVIHHWTVLIQLRHRSNHIVLTVNVNQHLVKLVIASHVPLHHLNNNDQVMIVLVVHVLLITVALLLMVHVFRRQDNGVRHKVRSV